jgi:hypothetical protein
VPGYVSSDGVDGPTPTASLCQAGAVATQQRKGAIHMEIRTLGIDLAKSVFQLHGVDAEGASSCARS